MAAKHEQTPEHQKAHDLAEQAIETAADGDEKKARELAEQAKSLDPKIAQEMTREIEEDRRQAESFEGDK